MYTGKVSKLQWSPPWIHRGSYFCWLSSQSRFPWEQSTILSFVPWEAKEEGHEV
jgi:hypothetical protein